MPKQKQESDKFDKHLEPTVKRLRVGRSFEKRNFVKDPKNEKSEFIAIDFKHKDLVSHRETILMKAPFPNFFREFLCSLNNNDLSDFFSKSVSSSQNI